MKKYIMAHGFRYRDEANDLTDKQFALVGASFINSEATTLKSLRMDREETYSLFIKDFDGANFKDKLERIINSALSDGINVTLSNTAEVESVENGYNITMTFYIQG